MKYNEVNCVDKKPGVEDRSHRDDRARAPDWPDCAVPEQWQAPPRSAWSWTSPSRCRQKLNPQTQEGTPRVDAAHGQCRGAGEYLLQIAVEREAAVRNHHAGNETSRKKWTMRRPMTNGGTEWCPIPLTCGRPGRSARPCRGTSGTSPCGGRR